MVVKPRLRQKLCLSALCLIGLGGASACQSQPGPTQPARIVSADMAILTDVLETIVGRSNISIVPEDVAGAETLSVPPPPLGEHETRSPALPRQFGVVMLEQNCLLRDEVTGEHYPVGGMNCERIGRSQ